MLGVAYLYFYFFGMPYNKTNYNFSNTFKLTKKSAVNYKKSTVLSLIFPFHHLILLNYNVFP